MLYETLTERRGELYGVVLPLADADRLRPLCPAWLLDVWRKVPLSGVRIYLDAKDDPTGIGVSMQWMTASELMSEAVEASPGREAAVHGFVPVGKCLEGSGDPYFVSREPYDSPLVRIPHGAARGGRLNVEAVETVAKSLSDFFRVVQIR